MFTSDVTKARFLHAITFTVNYRLFTHRDVSYRFNGENDNVVIELIILSMGKPTGAVYPYYVPILSPVTDSMFFLIPAYKTDTLVTSNRAHTSQ